MINEKPVRNRRSLQQLLVEPFKQVKIGLYFTLLSFVSFVVVGYTFWISSLKQYDQLMELFSVVGDEKWNVLANDTFIENLILMAIVFIALSVASVLISVWLTHRIYGPQVALRRFVREVRNGNFAARIYLRKADEFQQLADELNEMVEALGERLKNSSGQADDEENDREPTENCYDKAS